MSRFRSANGRPKNDEATTFASSTEAVRFANAVISDPPAYDLPNDFTPETFRAIHEALRFAWAAGYLHARSKLLG